MEAVPTWLGQLISSGIVMAVLGALIRFSFGSIIKRLEKIEMDIAGAKSDIHDIKLDRAEKMGELKAEAQLMWRDINTDKQKIVKLQSSVEKIWECLQKVVKIKRTSDKLTD